MAITEREFLVVLEGSRAAITAMAIRRLAAVQSRVDADDLLQIVAAKALSSLSSLNTDDLEVAGHWVRKIASTTSNGILEAEYARKRSVKRTDGMEIDQLAVPCQRESLDDLRDVEEAMQQIAPAQAKAVRMRYFELSEYDDIASELTCSIQAARSLVSRGIAAIRAIVS